MNQAIFSLGNFSATVIIGRSAGATQLGIYSLSLSSVFITAAVQRALVSSPYTVQVQSINGPQQNSRRGSALVQAIAIGFLLCLLLAIGADFLLSSDPDSRVTAWILAGAAASWGLRDFSRRILFADHRFGEAVVFDGIAVGLQIAALTYLVCKDQISAATALLAMVLSSGVVTICWLMLRRSIFEIRSSRLIPDFRASWRFGRWAALSEATFAGQDCAVQAILAASGGFAATGIFAACMSIVRLMNPLVQAIGNFIGPSSARSLHVGGIQKLTAGVGRISKWMVVAMLIYMAVIVAGGGMALVALYGTEYADQSSLLMVLALAAAVAALGMAPGKGISAMEQPQLNLLANALGFVVVLAGAWFSVESYHIAGVAYALLAGASVCSISKGILFRHFVSRQLSESKADE